MIFSTREPGELILGGGGINREGINNRSNQTGSPADLANDLDAAALLHMHLIIDDYDRVNDGHIPLYFRAVITMGRGRCFEILLWHVLVPAGEARLTSNGPHLADRVPSQYTSSGRSSILLLYTTM